MHEGADPYSFLQRLLEELAPGEKIRVPKDHLPLAPYPSWRRSIGYPVKGAILRQFRDGCYHIHEARAEWVLHRDLHNPHESPLRHLYHDCPRAFWTAVGLLTVSVMAAAGATARAIVDS